jgi:hypothetical protein
MLYIRRTGFLTVLIFEWYAIFDKKKCVAYPQEDFLFTILYGNFSRPQKKYIYYPKSEKNKDTYRIYPKKFARSFQKHKKVIETPNQQIEIKKISK